MNWAQFKDHVSHMCLAGAVVASWSLMQERSRFEPILMIIFFLLLNSLNCSENIWEKLQYDSYFEVQNSK